MKSNIVYILSFVNKSVAFEWIVTNLDKTKYNLTFILLNSDDSPLESFLKSEGVNTYRIKYNSKKDIPNAILETISILKKNKTDIVHTHLFDACIVGLIAAKIIGTKKRIHTRHNATIHHQYYPKAVKYDKLINYLSTDIIAISENVKNILIDMEQADGKKIHLIHHGFKTDEFESNSNDRINNLKAKHLPGNIKGPVIGVISRYIHWKGIQYIIPAFKLFKEKYPNAHLVFANATGPYEKEIKTLLTELPENSYTEILFEEDIFALYKLFDVFVHTPIDEKSEAFGQVYVESMAAGIPTIVTMSGIAGEYIENRKNALVVPFKDSLEIYNSLCDLIENELLRTTIIANGKESIEKLFTLDKMINKLENLYDK